MGWVDVVHSGVGQREMGCIGTKRNGLERGIDRSRRGVERVGRKEGTMAMRTCPGPMVTRVT